VAAKQRWRWHVSIIHQADLNYLNYWRIYAAVCLLDDLRWAGSVRTLVDPARPAVRPKGGGAFTYTYYLCPWTPTNPRDVARCPGHARSCVRGDHITTAINRHTFSLNDHELNG
jgi:hypothetical protein